MTLPQIALLAALCCASVPLAFQAPAWVVALTMAAAGGLMAEWIAEAKEG
jgi:hypothetical protein